jgi:preprotein translocase subunit SecB
MATPAINIRAYTVERLEIAERRGTYDPSVPLFSQIEVQFAANAEAGADHRFGVALRLKLHDEGLPRPANMPYWLTIHLSGVFDTRGTVAPTAIPAPLVHNALTLLYGVARGIVGDATSNFPRGRIVLPSVTFDSLVEKAQRDPATPVVPSAETLQVGDPVAATYFRFHFAIEDFARTAALLEEQVRRPVLQPFGQLIVAMNRLPIKPDASTADDLEKALADVASVLDTLDEPIASVLRMHVEQIRAGVDLAIKNIRSQVQLREAEAPPPGAAKRARRPNQAGKRTAAHK